MKIDVEQVRAMIGQLGIVSSPGLLMTDLPLHQQGVDSLDFVNLLFRFEEDYHIKLPDSEVDGVKSINDIVALVNSKLGE
jgi:acyl carrier protein